MRKVLAVTITTPGGDNPLLMDFITDGPFYRGIPIVVDSNGDSPMMLVGKGGKAPYAFSILAGGDSNGDINGLTLDPNGAFHGTPSASGHFAFVAEVQDDNADVFPHSFAVDFLTQLVVVSEPPRPGEIDVDYTFQFIVEDFTGFRLTSGYSLHSGDVLPNGFSLAANGLLTATPPAEPYGVSVFRVDATDGTDTITIPVTLTVYEAVTGSWLLQIHSLSSHTDQIPDQYSGVFWSDTLQILGGHGPFTTTMGAGWLPGIVMGVNSALRSRNILFSGVPRINEGIAPQVEPVTVLITDALGGVFSYQVLCYQAWPQKPFAILNDGTNVGAFGPEEIDFIGEGGISVHTSTAGIRRIIRIVGGGAPDSNGDVPSTGGIQTINDVPPDSSGNLEIVSPDASIEFGQDSNGQLTARAISSGGGSAIRCRLATFDQLPANTYNNGASGVGATLTANANGALVVDGRTVALNDRILVLWEFPGANNGVFFVSATGDGSHPWILTRDSRMDESAEFTATLVAVGPDGLKYFDTLWQCAAIEFMVVGTDEAFFVQQNFQGEYIPLTYRRDDLIAVGGEDELVLDRPPYSVTSNTLTITVNGVMLSTTQYTTASTTVYDLVTPLSASDVVIVSYWVALNDAFNPTILQTSGTGHRYYRVTFNANGGNATYKCMVDELEWEDNNTNFNVQTNPTDAINGAATSSTATVPAANAFDVAGTNVADWGATWYTTDTLPQSLTYDFGFNNAGTRLDLHNFGIVLSHINRDKVDAWPTDFVLEASNDNAIWTTLLTVTGFDWSSYGTPSGDDVIFGWSW